MFEANHIIDIKRNERIYSDSTLKTRFECEICLEDMEDVISWVVQNLTGPWVSWRHTFAMDAENRMGRCASYLTVEFIEGEGDELIRLFKETWFQSKLK